MLDRPSTSYDGLALPLAPLSSDKTPPDSPTAADVPISTKAYGICKKRKSESRESTHPKKRTIVTPSLTPTQNQENPQENDQSEMHLENVQKKKCKASYYFYTFVMEGKPILPAKNIDNNIPKFIVVDHNDHTHIAFYSSTNNASGRGKRVWNFIKPVDEDRQIQRTPTLRISDEEFKDWVLVLVKDGIKYISYFGEEDATFKHVANTQYSFINESSEIGPCKYRTGRPEKTIIRKKSKNELDYEYVWDIAAEKNVRTPDELYEAMSEWELKQYYGHFGTSLNQKTKIIMRNLNLVRHREELDESIVERFIRTEPKKIVHSELEIWLDNFFSLNKLNMINFLAWFIIIADRRFMKINTLVIRGPPNSGKSVVLNTLLEGENFARFVRGGKQMMLENLLDKNYGLYEEPDVPSRLSNTFKLLFEGTPIAINVKRNDSRTLQRTPMFISTNHPLEDSVCPTDKIAFRTRFKEFVFNSPIEHENYAFENPLEAPPRRITHDLWVHIFKKNRIQLEEEVERILKIKKKK
ncbi:UNVERIFIED_CONTAM: hypothetical protein RMT77_003790 [Armadillidium vulgare]